MNTRVILIRHGQSTYNAQGLYQGCSDDSVLTPKGRLDAYQTGIVLSHYPLTALYSSPLRRTQETAQEILSAIASLTDRAPILHLHPKLKEISLPAWQGLPFKQVREQLADDYRCWKERPHEFKMVQNSEDESAIATFASLEQSVTFPVQDLYEQARQFWQAVLPHHVGETIAVVSHGGTIKALISTAIEMNCTHFHALQQSNGGISALEFSPDRVQLTAMNITAHLGEVLPKLKDGKLGLRLILLPAQTTALAPIQTRLDQLAIDFCIASETIQSQAVAEALLRSRPQPIVHLPIADTNFLQTWHRTIHCQSQQCPNLCTGLVIAEAEQIQTLLQQVLGFPRSSAIALQGLSILYYPKASPTPVLQSLNLLN
ncbi:MAG: histidine phosphatase family protein [Leptolyngbyaceae cyanobacterium CSU_1_3]|nr:histidine phosphatase family protein [Leptolyngbyaceae cyanobacterium CSU_1_3]